ncbi:putative CBL-interacting serine/threonine-protein kinase 21 [Monocercomonoides exilis]|uniref:putative CBL-interacting serine/threonine-protein kinase 21 n=1 Tax=Monocercomonoides exilis TaxID=2049356 RepID=UPI003559AAFF|nr:putative CBL-interacting serine/threonine-protein kinase 21 [Monocercomonoides exilis]|eukprot:MONOS_5169.1-p1 / transcript=MONOS_5169.1 / gene=MONOS_5169 / organism=Monocercomonoides_exilis_PA203 / gene_product=rCG64303 / transcript_product=rCG64303 / location=Mono_scaffold00147:82931-84415(-) / protein_length=339 / sequence_SO=supercontig / SO=protein_coding / is_pseudo=false
MEYASGGAMSFFISRFGAFQENTARMLFRQLISAVDYLHQHDYAHRDIKPDNVMFLKACFHVPGSTSGSGPGHSIRRFAPAPFTPPHLKLMDFGLAARAGKSGRVLTRACGTSYYMSPEMMTERFYDGKAADIWALGVTLYEMMTGRHPFFGEGCSGSQLTDHIIRCQYRFPPLFPPDAADLIQRMLTPTPQLRITIREILTHAWVVSNSTYTPYQSTSPIKYLISTSSSIYPDPLLDVSEELKSELAGWVAAKEKEKENAANPADSEKPKNQEQDAKAAGADASKPKREMESDPKVVQKAKEEENQIRKGKNREELTKGAEATQQKEEAKENIVAVKG